MSYGNDKDKTIDDLMADITQLFGGRKGSKGGHNGGNGSGGGTGGDDNEGPDIKGLLPIILVAVLALGGYNSFYTVEENERAVVTRFGLFHSAKEPGPHFRLPLVDKVYKVSVKILEEEFGYRKSTNRRINTHQTLKDESQMLTGDLNLADVEWMVQYQVMDPQKYLFNVRDVQKTIRDVSMSMMRRAVGDKMVGEILTSARTEIALEVTELMQEALDALEVGIKVRSVVMQSVDPPDEVKPAFNAVTAAKQEQERTINQAEGEYNKVIPEARGRAQQAIADAEAYAVDVVNRAKGEAEYFTSIAAAYKLAPDITRKRLYIDTMEEVFRKSQGFTLVDDRVSGVLPVFGQKMFGGGVASPKGGNQ